MPEVVDPPVFGPPILDPPISDPLDSGEFQQAWIAFIKSVNRVIAQKAEQPNRSYVKDNYLDFANSTAEILLQPNYSYEIARSWSELRKNDQTNAGAQLLLEEVRNYPILAETVLQNSYTDAPRVNAPYKLKDALSIAKTIIKSITELLNLSAWGKLFIKLYGEAIDIFKGA